MFCYQLYGLSIASEFELPLLPIGSTEQIDMTISLTPQIETTLTNPKLLNAYQIDKDRNVLFTGPFGWLLVKDGRSIQVRLNSEAQQALAVQYILGSGMAIILYQRETLVIHASAVCKDGAATLFVGKSGLGKSATAALLQTAGYKLLSDDLSVITFKDGMPWVHPGYPNQKIATDILTDLKILVTNDKKTTADGRDKYFHHASAFSNKSVPVKYIYNLLKSDIDHPLVSQESELRKFHHLYRNSFRFKLIRCLGFSQKHLSLCQELFKKTAVSFLLRPSVKLNLAGTLKAIIDHRKKSELNADDEYSGNLPKV